MDDMVFGLLELIERTIYFIIRAAIWAAIGLALLAASAVTLALGGAVVFVVLVIIRTVTG